MILFAKMKGKCENYGINYFLETVEYSEKNVLETQESQRACVLAEKIIRFVGLRRQPKGWIIEKTQVGR